MIIKPIYDTGTITFVESPEKLKFKKIDSTYVKDPKGIIPNGIYKVFKHERNKQTFLISSIIICVIVLSIFIGLFIPNIIKVHWLWIASFILADVLFLVRLTYVAMDTYNLSKSIKMYRESIVAGSRLTPPFVSTLYKKLFLKQTRQNWEVFAFVFYGTIFVLLFWWLKDVNWWIFTFKDWIHKIAPNPILVGSIAITILLVVVLLHIYFTIYRKKRMIDIQSFFGNEVISQLEIDKLVHEKSKFYGKMFFLSVLIVLVLPILIRIIYKKFIKK